MVSNQEIVDKAREFIGTPYEHQGRLKGVGIDCCGLIICVAHELDLVRYDITDYSRWGDGADLLREFGEQCTPTDAPPEPGDIVVFSIGRIPRHCGIVASKNGNPTLIHAYATIKKCVEHNLDKAWSDRIVAVYSFPGVE